MIAIKSSSAPAAGHNSPAAPLNLNARLEAATEALLKTRDQVIEALDHHLNELDLLRRALSNPDRPLLTVVPGPAAVLPSYTPAPTPAPIFADRAAPPPMPAIPMMTQVLWPSKSPIAEPPPAAQQARVPVSSPLVAYSALQNSAAQDMTVAPDLEKATLEELNAALAYAFSHVSNARSSGVGSML